MEGRLPPSPSREPETGSAVGSCGNSGNSTQPHLHIQAMDGPDLDVARGVPLRFEEFRQHAPGRRAAPAHRRLARPDQGSVISAA